MSIRSTPADSQETGDINQSISQVEQDSDPPPVYTRNPQFTDLRPVYELPAEAMDTPATDNTVRPHALPPTDHEQNQVARDTDQPPDVETPLLARPRSIQEHETCPKLTWRRRWGKRRRSCIVFTVIISSTILSLLLLMILGIKEFVSFLFRCLSSLPTLSG